ncbi:MAG: AI-2E family transporter [Sphingobacteriaceae bacterium]|nr:AI-2E family transporter [Sphingobacteriaceae bacterium]
MGSKLTISKSVQILLLLFLVLAGLFYTRTFLIPIAFAGIISMLLLPLSRRLEGRGLTRGLSATICLLVFILSVSGIIALLVWQITDLAKDFSQLEQKVGQATDQLKAFVNAKLGIPQAEQEKIIKQQQQSGQGAASKIVSGFMAMLVDIILVLVYTFLFIYFRSHLRTFIMKLTPSSEHDRANKVINDSTQVAHKYLTGMFMMIVLLWFLYGIGFLIAGVPNAIFFAVLCGILEIVPFVGNLTGSGITFIMALSQGGSSVAIGVVITYAFVQFLQTYIIEPLVVGGEVNINPLFTILVLILGEELWGIPGMILAIPLLGITKIVFDNVEALKPYGFLIGEEKKKKHDGLMGKVKSWFNKSAAKKKRLS